MGYEHRSDSQQMDYRNDHKLRCWKCEGTGFVSHEEGPEGATWTVKEPCKSCGGSGHR